MAGLAQPDVRGERSVLTPGYFDHHNSTGWAGVSHPFGREDRLYAMVTQAPTKGFALFESDGFVPRKITDLRTGADQPFQMWGSGPYLEGAARGSRRAGARRLRRHGTKCSRMSRGDPSAAYRQVR